MRVIATRDPDRSRICICRPSLSQIASLKNGIVLVTGPTGSGKSSTLAAIIDLINETRAEHIITIEDPIEFLHQHKKATVHQRELHSDTPTFALALRAALRQAPKVILVGEMRDRETMEIALTAAETGPSGVLDAPHHRRLEDRRAHRRHVRGRGSACGPHRAWPRRSATSFRSAWCPRRAAAASRCSKMLKSTMRTRDYIERGDGEGRSLLDAMRDGELDGMQHFDGELESWRAPASSRHANALLYATNAGNLTVQIARHAGAPDVSA